MDLRIRIRIRLARPSDAPAIGRLVRRVTWRDILPDQTAAAAAYLLRGMSARAERAHIKAGRRYHVAFVEGRLAGVVATRDDRHFFRLFVTRRFQRRGIARALLQAALADCHRRSRTRKFTLHASACAGAAYRRMGFVAAGRLKARGPGAVAARPMVYRLRGPAASARPARHRPGHT